MAELEYASEQPEVETWPKWVTAYDHNRSYGGPEEGGWWYDTGSVLATIRCLNDDDVARAKELLKETYGPRFEGNHDIGSVICEGVLQIVVEDEPGKDYPEVKPHYE